MSAAEWLAAKARSYYRDARALEATGEAPLTPDMTGQQWVIVYRAIAEELTKCAKELGKQ